MSTTHLLARAIIRDAGHILLVRARGQPHVFLPGGHVEEGEGLAGCLRRELQEELGVTAHVNHYRGTVEHRWWRDGNCQYELNHCFAVDVPTLSADVAPTAREGYLTFGWVPAEQAALADVDLQPAPLRHLLPGADAAAPWWESTLDEAASPEKD
jgi:8-oxo-dGTP pyrophosphatase MutT (NUDIX family)